MVKSNICEHTPYQQCNKFLKLLSDHSGETGFVGSRLKDARMALNVKEEYSSLLPQIKLVGHLRDSFFYFKVFCRH